MLNHLPVWLNSAIPGRQSLRQDIGEEFSSGAGTDLGLPARNTEVLSLDFGPEIPVGGQIFSASTWNSLPQGVGMAPVPRCLEKASI